MAGTPPDAPPARKAGRRPKLSAAQQAALVEAVRSGQRSAAEMARHHQISEATVSRLLAAARTPVPPPATDEPVSERILGVLPAVALDARLAIVGTSGAGKTYATKGLVERLLQEGARVCIVDPLGVWWGLRLAADGTSPADHKVVVFGGAHADIPLTAGMGDALGRLVGTAAPACVVDVSELSSAAAQRSFMTAFTAALYVSNAAPLHLVLDEADLWAPQRVRRDGYELLGRVEEIVCRGRVRGFVPWLITQRPAVLHKDVLSQATILVAMQLTASQDRAAIGRWIEGQADQAEGRRILATLPRLGRGEGWVWAPAHAVLAPVAFPRIHTLDSSATPSRVDRMPPILPAPLDLAALVAALDSDAAAADHAGHPEARALAQRLRQREQDLARALGRIAALEGKLRALAADTMDQSSAPSS